MFEFSVKAHKDCFVLFQNLLGETIDLGETLPELYVSFCLVLTFAMQLDIIFSKFLVEEVSLK